MLKKVSRYIVEKALVAPGDAVVIACSGGPDSLALLDILYQLKDELGVRLVVAHVNHMFRPEAAQEAVFVDKMARTLNLPSYTIAIDVPEYIEKTGLSKQEAARMVRYQYLNEIAEKYAGAKIATGHHRDDQAETVLLHLLRGAGASGLQGMEAASGNIIRPLLPVTRNEIEAYCKERQLRPCYDSSNSNTDYLRNRVRLKLIPYLAEQYNPAIVDSLCRMAELIGDEHAVISSIAVKAVQDVVKWVNDSASINCSLFSQHPVAVRREIIRQVLEKKQKHLKGITFFHVEKLIDMALQGTTGSILHLPGGLAAKKGYAVLTILDNKQARPETTAIPSPGVEITIPGMTAVPELQLIITAEVSTTPLPVSGSNQAIFALDELSLPLMVRTRQDGDRFRPKGMKGSKKLKEFFIDLKVPREVRDAIPVICDSREIIWIAGWRQGERGKIEANTREFLRLTITKQEEH